jgi:AcrR family transcriptional regulator
MTKAIKKQVAMPSPFKQVANVRKFLNVLATTGNITKAAKAIGVHRSAANYWRKRDARFAEAWDEAIETALDELEEAARIRAIDGPKLQTTNKYGEVVDYQGAPSDVMTKYLLDRGRYDKQRVREAQKIEHTHWLKLTDAQLEAIAAKGLPKETAMLGEGEKDESIVDAEFEIPKPPEKKYVPTTEPGIVSKANKGGGFS